MGLELVGWGKWGNWVIEVALTFFDGPGSSRGMRVHKWDKTEARFMDSMIFWISKARNVCKSIFSENTEKICPRKQ